MSFALPTGWPGRMLALGILLVVILVVWLGIASPLIGLYQDRADQLTQHRALAAKMAQVAALLPTLQKEADEQANDVRPPSLLLSGGTDALAAAQLQEKLEKAAGTSGIVILSAESVPVQNVGAVRRIGLKLNLSGKFGPLVSFLQEIDTSTPPLMVDELQIQGSPSPDEPETDLLTSMTIYGFRAGEKRS